MAIYREHRGMLQDSMKTCRDVSSLDDIEGAAFCRYYGPDPRIDWECFIVTNERDQAMGFANEMLYKINP